MYSPRLDGRERHGEGGRKKKGRGEGREREGGSVHVDYIDTYTCESTNHESVLMHISASGSVRLSWTPSTSLARSRCPVRAMTTLMIPTSSETLVG